MKKVLLLFIAIFSLYSCTKEIEKTSLIQRDNNVFILTSAETGEIDTLSTFPDSLRIEIESMKLSDDDIGYISTMKNKKTSRLVMIKGNESYTLDNGSSKIHDATAWYFVGSGIMLFLLLIAIIGSIFD